MRAKNITTAVRGAVCTLLFGGLGVHAQTQTLFVGDYSTDSILEYSGGTESTFATGLNYPTGLAFDSAGDLFESDQFSGNIYEWSAGGNTMTTFASGLDQPAFLAFNQAGDLFVNVNGGAEELNPLGTVINTISGLSTSSGMAFDSAGNLYIANLNGSGAGQGFITRITPTGVQSTFAAGLNYPTWLTFNSAGDLFVSNGGSFDSITEIAPDGSESLFASELNNPNAIVFDQAGDMFVGDEGGDITEFAADGTQSIFATGIIPTSLAFDEALPVPEPSACALVGLGVATLVVRSLKKQKTV
jgi:hypothetical protein